MLNQKLIDFRFMDPLTLGEYPKSMRSLVGARLPKFNTKQAKLLIGSFDFLGINYYSSAYASDAPLLSNVRPSYLTDSLVNPACKKLFFFSYGFSNYLHSLNLKIVDNGICFLFLVNAVERNGKPIGIKVRVYRSILKKLLHV
jgi:hypothetical protein